MTTQQPTLDSREVAEMVEKQHDQLLRTIRGYIEILDGADSAKLQSQNFFIPSVYLNSQNKEQPCFLITKKGCDLIANKMTGEKGILFTATYVTKFEEMTKQLQRFTPYAATRQTIGEVANLLREARLIAKDGGISLAKAIESITLYLQAKGEPLSDDIARLLREKEAAETLQSKQLTLFGFDEHRGA